MILCNLEELEIDLRDALLIGPMSELKARLDKVWQKYFKKDFRAL